MANVQPDVLYLKTREQLLPYEDARFNSLIQAVVNYYMTRNDQSTWGNVLRAVAEELARFEYFYAYDLINKIPSYLTPPDIRRRWADPLYVSNNWPSSQQFDTTFQMMLVDLIAAYRLGSTVVSIEDVILAYTGIDITVIELYKLIGNGFYDQSDRNAILASVNVGNAGSNPLNTVTSFLQLQNIVQSLYGAIDLAKPAHVGLEFTTVFGEGEELACLLSPTTLTQQMYDTLSTTAQTYYTQTGYVLTNPPSFWRASTSYVNINSTNGLGLLVVDANGNIQMVTGLTGSGVNYGKSGGSTPAWSLIAGGTTTDGNVIWTCISVAVTNISVAGNVLTVTAANNVLVGQQVIFVNLGNAVFLNSLLLSSPILRQTVTVLTASPTQFTAAFTDTAYVTQVAVGAGPNFPLTVTCSNNFQPGMTIKFSGLLGATFLNGQSVVVSTASANQFTVANTSFPTQASTADSGTAAMIDYPSTAETQGTAAYVPASSITVAQYNALSTSLKTLYQAQYTNTNCNTMGITDTLEIIIQEIEQPPFDQMLIQAPVLNPNNPTTTLAAWGTRVSGVPTLTPSQWANLPVINFQITSTVSNGTVATYTYANLNNSPGPLVPPQLQLHEGELVTITGCTSTPTNALNGTAKIRNVTATTFEIANPKTLPVTSQTGTGVVAPTIASAYILQYGQYVINPSAPVLTQPTGSPYPAIAPTTIGGQPTVNPPFTSPIKWVEVSVFYNGNWTPTGEIGNWDFTHPMGLVSPRLDQVWEISGGDQYFIFDLT